MAPEVRLLRKTVHGTGREVKGERDFVAPHKDCRDGVLVAITQSSPMHVRIDNEPPAFFSQATTWISLFALILSFCNFGWTLYKENRAQKKSVIDDFWIRKVLFETAVNPALEFMARAETEIPDGCNDVVIRDFLEKFGAEHRSMMARFLVVGVFDGDIGKDLRTILEEFEDSVADYCGSLKLEFDLKRRKELRSTLVLDIQSFAVKILQSIKRYQEQIR